MAKAKVIRDEKIILEDGRYIAEIKVYEITVSKKFPDGIIKF